MHHERIERTQLLSAAVLALFAACGGTQAAQSTQPAPVTPAAAGAPSCEPVTCAIFCSNGFVTDEIGCETCKCASGPAAECAPVTCEINCDRGFEADERGCSICECK